MLAILKFVAWIVAILAWLFVTGFLFVLIEPWGIFAEILLVAMLIVVPMLVLEMRVASGQVKGWFDTPDPLPSFRDGFPVTIDLPGQTTTIDTMEVHARCPGVAQALLMNFAWIFKRDFDAPIGQYRCVRLCGKYREIDAGEAPPGLQLAIQVTLEHPDRRKTVLLGARKWGGLETIDDFADHLVVPLRALCNEAADALSLPVAEDGILTRAALGSSRAGS